MTRERTTTLSKRRLEDFTRGKLFSEIHSLIEEPSLIASWGSIFSEILAAPVFDDLSGLPHLLEGVGDDKLIDCALALRTALESAQESAAVQSMRKVRRMRQKQRTSSAVRVTTSEAWLRARERRSEKTLHSSRRSGLQPPIIDDAFRHKPQDVPDLAAQNRGEFEELRVRLQNSEQERDKLEQQRSASKGHLHQIATAQDSTNIELSVLRQQTKAQEVALGRLQTDVDEAIETETFNQNLLHENAIEMRQKETALATMLENLQSCQAQRDELRTQRDGLEAALRIARSEWKSAQHQLTDALSIISRQQRHLSDAPGGVCADAITCWTDGTFASGNWSLSPCSSAAESTSLYAGSISDYVQNVQLHRGSDHPMRVTNSHEMDGDESSPPAGLPPRCCDETPVARTNAGCELCPDHCEQFTWFSPAEIGMYTRGGVVTCPACDGPSCEWAQLSSCNLTDQRIP